jgi:hypothetical protein
MDTVTLILLTVRGLVAVADPMLVEHLWGGPRQRGQVRDAE